MPIPPIPLWQVLKDEYESFHGETPEAYAAGNVSVLAKALKAPQTALSKYIAGRLPKDVSRKVAAWDGAEPLPDELRSDLSEVFYGILSDEGLLKNDDSPARVGAALAGAGVSRTLDELGKKLQPSEVYQVNARLLEAAYPGLTGRIDWKAKAPDEEEKRRRWDEERLRSIYTIISQQRHSALCLSGGGIRSGTFALGVIQSLAQRGLLTQFDYLSTVSGGGYIGGWLTAWIHRHQRGLDGVVDELNGVTRTSRINPEPEPLQHLRDYSNFITPRPGLLSADTWTFVVIYIRNLLLNWVVLIPLLASVLMIPRVANAITLAPQAWRVLGGLLLLGGFGVLLLKTEKNKKTILMMLVLGVASLLLLWRGWLSALEANPRHAALIEGALLAAGTLLGGYTLAYMRLSRPSNTGAVRQGSFWDRHRGQTSFLWLCLLPLTISTMLLTTFWAWLRRTTGLSTENPVQCVSFLSWDESPQHAKCLKLFNWFGWEGWQVGEFGGFLIYGFLLGLTGWFLYVVFAGFSWWGGRGEVRLMLKHRRRKLFADIFWNAWRELIVTLLASIIGSILLYVAATKIPIFYDPVADPYNPSGYSAELYTWLAFPVYLFVFFLGITLFVGFTSRRSEKPPREQRRRAAVRGRVARALDWVRHPFDAAYVEDEDREWMARASAWIFIVIGGWVFLGGLVIFGPLLYFVLGKWLAGIGGASGLVALLGGRSARTPGNKKEEAQGGLWQTLGVNLLVVAAFIFFACIVIAVSLLTGTVIAWLAKYFSTDFAALLGISARNLTEFAESYPFQSEENVFRVLHFPSWLYLLALAIGLHLFGRLFARLINLNKFSLHAGYRDRIIRAFLGASRLKGERQANPFTGFDPRDNLNMAELRPWLLRESDFERDGLKRFVDELNKPVDARKEVANFLRERIEQTEGESRKYFKDPPGSVEINPSFRSALFGDLNRILQEEDIPLDGEAPSPPRAGDDSDGAARIRRNRQRLKEAFDYIKDPPPPYRLMHVVNMALNLVGGDRLAWQQRRAESFTSTPLHSGSLFVGYRRTSDYGGKNGITLGTAVAISGAAASSNMGYFSPSVFVTFVLTFFNARLGWWLGNPGEHGADTFFRSHPQNALSPIIDEAFGLTNDKNPYVLLSDGGHFENLGLYEMVVRRCRNIIVVDGSADPEGAYSDLGGAVRKIRIDLGIRIEFDRPFTIYPRPESEEGEKSEKGGYVAIGRIHYEEVDGNNLVSAGAGGGASDLTGTLVYIKPAFYGREPRDIYNYAKGDPTFPHESTADQFFDEPQFESHRMLGFYILRKLLDDASKDSPAPDNVEQFVALLEKKAQE